MSALVDSLAEEVAALDAYSSIVTHVAEVVLPSVVSVRLQRGGGSGVVLSGDGLVLTSAHVVERSDGGVAALGDGRELDFTVVGADRLSDLAVLRVAGADLPAATIGDAATLRVGQLVVAVGSPLGFAGSISAGVVSALGRSITANDGQRARIVDDVIQTDAALHPGSSGGALATSTGAVVGINTAVVGLMIGQGLGLAVPLNAATSQIIAALISDGRVRRAYLGLAGGARALPPRAAATLGRERGLEITSVVSGSPAATAGLRPEEIIVAIDGEPVTGIADLQRLLGASHIGRPTTITVVHGGKVRAVEVIPSEL